MADNPSDLVGKEFIFEYGVDRILPPSDKTGGVFATEQRAFRRERVVRCRDCAMSQRLGRVLYCMRPLDGGGCSKVTEDGFCAWGKEREA